MGDQLDTRLQQFIQKMDAQLEGQPYDIMVQVYSQNTYIPVAAKCFAFMFTNVGDTPATIKGMIVYPSATPTTALGDSRTISGHKLDIYAGTMDLSFRPPIGTAQA